MKAKQAIEWLQALDPDEEILMAYWNLEWVNEILTGQDHPPATAEEWAENVRNREHEALLYEDLADALEQGALELIEEREDSEQTNSRV